MESNEILEARKEHLRAELRRIDAELKEIREIRDQLATELMELEG